MEWLVVVILIGLYLLPSLVAARRKHNNEHAIVALNILLGWTLLGWVAALVWALTPSQPTTIRLQPEREKSQSQPAGEPFDRARWEALRKYDTEIAAVADKIDVLGKKWSDQFARDYLALNEKQYLRQIVEKIVADARSEIAARQVEEATAAIARKRRRTREFIGAAAAIWVFLIVGGLIGYKQFESAAVERTRLQTLREMNPSAYLAELRNSGDPRFEREYSTLDPQGYGRFLAERQAAEKRAGQERLSKLAEEVEREKRRLEDPTEVARLLIGSDRAKATGNITSDRFVVSYSLEPWALTTSTTRMSWEEHVVKAVPEIFARFPKINTVVIQGRGKFRDVRGNESEKDALVATFHRANAAAIHWDRIDHSKVDQLADTFWQHPGFK